MDTYLPGVLSLADAELKEELESFGKDLGPIVDSTRDLYQKMLAKLMAENAVGKCQSLKINHVVSIKVAVLFQLLNCSSHY